MERNSNLDVIKFISCFFVIYLHSFVKPSINLGADYIEVLSRVAVPLFLMISGYYYPTLVDKGMQSRYMKKVFGLTLFSSAFYICFCFHSIAITLDTMIIWIVFNEYPFSFHLWYLYALLYVLLIISVFGQRILKYATEISFFLILINIILSFECAPYWYRNALFLGLPYFLLGYSIHVYQNKLSRLCLFKHKWITTFFLILLLWAEYYIYKETDLHPKRNHYIFIYPLVAYIFCCAILFPSKSRGIFAYIGQHYSTGIYVFHIFMMSVTSYIVHNYIGENILILIENHYIYPVIIMIVTIFFVISYKTLFLLLRLR